MIVRGRTVLLRTVREGDLDTLYAFFTDIENRGLYFPIFIPSETQFKREFAENGFWQNDEGDALICDLDGSILGVILFFRATPYFDGFEIGYRLFDPVYSGRGAMTEALALMTYVLFAMKKINRLELKIMPENTASVRVAEKNGYTLEGVARGCLFHRGAYRDMAIYALLRSEAPATLEEALKRIS